MRPPLEELMDAQLRGCHLASSDRALLWEIVFGTVRWRRLLEWHIERHVHKLASLPLPVRMLLLTGSYQIIFLSRVPYFAAVNEAVKAAKALRISWAKGLINAVLRKISSSTKVVPTQETFYEDRCQKRFLNCLSVFSSHPYWMVKRWNENWGKTDCLSICVNNNIHPPVTIRANTLRSTRKELSSLLLRSGIETKRGTISPDALILKDYRGRIQELPGFDRGLFQVQDEASQIVSLMLNPEPGQYVLDLCAGVGGKSTHIAALMKNQGQLICSDSSRKRLRKLAENASRLGTKAIKILSPAKSKEMMSAGGQRFHRILVDAPCSGTGVIRRHPDIKWNRTPAMLTDLVTIQSDLLDKAGGLLAKGGILVYSVCSLEKEEGEDRIERFVEKNTDFSLIDPYTILPGTVQGMITPKGYFRSLPGQQGMDGFFAAALAKG